MTVASRASMARSSASVIASAPGRAGCASCSPPKPSTNRETLSTLVARRLPVRIWAGSATVSVPGAAQEAQ